MDARYLLTCAALLGAACSSEPTAESPNSAVVEGPAAAHSGAAIREYEVTIRNLTYGQPLSPGVLVTHTVHADLFHLGATASEGIRLIAENGDPSVAASELASAPGVSTVVTTAAPVHRIGGPGATSLTVTIAAHEWARQLSLSVMLICTNDGFAGVNGVTLPRGFEPVMFRARAYDAGTEENSEASNDIVPPCFGIGPVTGLAGGGGRIASRSNIRYHRGIQGHGDLDAAAHGWDGPVAEVTVRRTR
jgi:hypothetical protein